jgi:hypothetical protein
VDIAPATDIVSKQDVGDAQNGHNDVSVASGSESK